MTKLRVALGGGQLVEVDFPASSYDTLPLAGAAVQLVVRQASIVVIAPRGDAQEYTPALPMQVDAGER